MRISLGVLVYVVVGMVVAARHHFLAHLQTMDQFVSAILAVLLWPLVLLGVHAHI